jgi:hypothetical protein
MKLLTSITLFVLLSVGAVWCNEREAAMLADTGVTLLATSKDKAKDFFYKALAHDGNCAIALYELGKLFEAEGQNVSAADFFGRAALAFAKGEKADPAFAAKKSDAQRRLQKLNPLAMQYNWAMEDYAAELTKVAKNSPDSLTLEEAHSRVEKLELYKILPPEKMPKLPKPIASRSNSSNSSSGGTSVTPDIERALKAAGWTTITGVWKKKAEGVYEVTDGKLETAKVNGAVQVVVGAGTGSLKVLVRNGHSERDMGFTGVSANDPMVASFMERYATGYGCIVTRDRECQIFAPAGGWMSSDSFFPSKHHSLRLPDGKALILVTVQDTDKASRVEISVNNKRENLSNYRISRSGPFTIEITGTLTIETPKAAGS